ncbi:hypothetical protein C7974DRAFT_18905 [Boeremia exigua]|uniref:uncharacterized protein n=1 Tax=Boeremia exigua TaxID=749465 RepID=UPI001E8E8B30|nr:uncharacterized protein C7974DRAFT_18905 [Boeremia exigua]KAH6644351.1 hypothetical protein C7974DRAFT_18905 [Boeremia exigua]
MKPHRYLEADTSGSAKRRYQKKLRQRPHALANKKFSIFSQPSLRSLKPSPRKKLENERAPSLWILPRDIDFRSTEHGVVHPSASFLGLPAELRQCILLLSYQFQPVPETKFGPRDKKLHMRKRHTESRRLLTDQEYFNMCGVNDRIAELCRVCRVVCEDMQYVGKQWRSAAESSILKKIDVDAFESPGYTLVQGPVYSVKKAVVIQGNDRHLRGRRPGKCWYCTERHVAGQPRCPMATTDSQRWMQETRAIGGWRSRVHTSGLFQGTRVVFGD